MEGEEGEGLVKLAVVAGLPSRLLPPCGLRSYGLQVEGVEWCPGR